MVEFLAAGRDTPRPFFISSFGTVITELYPALQEIKRPEAGKYGIRIFVKRDDLLHPVTGGNKFRKLIYNIERARAENKSTLVTFGGAYSNHIAAAAYAGKEAGFKTIGLVRGEKTEPLNNTLTLATSCGMKLIYVSRAMYRNKNETLEQVFREYDKADLYVIPEGGNNEEGFKGCIEITREIEVDFDYICCPCGTGTTLAGIAASLKPHQTAIGFSVMKNNSDIDKTICNYAGKQTGNYTVIHDYHFGGYAKTNDALDGFVSTSKTDFQIPVEPVYTGKMFYGVYDLLAKGFFRENSTIIILHTGGLQYLNPAGLTT